MRSCIVIEKQLNEPVSDFPTLVRIDFFSLLCYNSGKEEAWGLLC